MRGYLAGILSALLVVAAGFFIWKGIAQRDEPLVPPAPQAALADPQAPEARPETPPAADARTREQRRFGRADRDDDGRITLEELFYPRRRAFARLDRNGDGRLAFEEWAHSTSEKFARADSNRDRALTPVEFATTAPRRRPQRRNCAC